MSTIELGVNTFTLSVDTATVSVDMVELGVQMPYLGHYQKMEKFRKAKLKKIIVQYFSFP